MKNRILLVLILCFGTLTHAQDQKFSATLSYPLTVGDNFLEEYTGYVDVGLQYRFWDLNVVKLGISVNASFLEITDPPREGEKFTAFLVYPRLFAEVPLGKFRPVAGFGYGINRFNNDADTTGLGVTSINRTYEGLVLNIGLSYDVSDRIFLLAQYDWADIDRSFVTIGNEKFNNRGNLIKIGAGIRF
jgi:hypothetical protein